MRSENDESGSELSADEMLKYGFKNMKYIKDKYQKFLRDN